MDFDGDLNLKSDKTGDLDSQIKILSALAKDLKQNISVQTRLSH